MQGFEGIWVKSRRNNCMYIMNKITSIAVAIFFASVSFTLKVYTNEFEAYTKEYKVEA